VGADLRSTNVNGQPTRAHNSPWTWIVFRIRKLIRAPFVGPPLLGFVKLFAWGMVITSALCLDHIFLGAKMEAARQYSCRLFS
jgi:hypothetical protein